MTDRAAETIAVITGTKFDRRARISGVPASDLDVVVTDNVRHPAAARLAQANVRIVEAGAV